MGREAPTSVLRHAVDRCCQELEVRLRQGESVGAETFLARNPLLASDTEAAVELIYQEFLTREDLGLQPSMEEFLTRFASWRERLARQFTMHSVLSDAIAGSDTEGEDSTGDSSSGFGPLLQRAGSYRILREVARSNNVIYEAIQPGTGRRVALKCIGEGEQEDEEARTQLLAEARTASRLRHPNIVQVLDVGVLDDMPFLAMEFIEGQSLARWLKDARPTPRHAARIVEIMARALQYAHTQGVIHRDLSPANVMLTADGTPIITDFGLAMHSGQARRRKRLGAMVGTPGYMAPEQVGGASGVTAVADIHALGAILYEMLAGRPPFPSALTLEALERLIHDPAVSPRRHRREIPPALDAICLKCLEKNPEDRYPTAGELADDLARFARGETIRGSRLAWPARGRALLRKTQHFSIVGLLALLLVAAGLGGLAWQLQRLRHDLRTSQAKLADRSPIDRLLRKAEARAQQSHMQTRRLRYAMDLRRAQQAINAHHDVLATDLLDGLRPWDHEPDLRGFEWYVLAHRLNHPVAILPIAHEAAVYTAAVSPDGRRLTTGDSAGNLVLWEARTLQPRSIVPAYESIVTYLRYTPDGQRLLSACNDPRGRRQVNLWEAETLQPLGEPVPLQTDLQYLNVSADGRTLVFREYDPVDRSRLWKITADGLRAWRTDLDARHLAVSPDGLHLAAVRRDDTLSIEPLDLAPGARAWTQKIGERVEGVAWRPDGSGVVLITASGSLMAITPERGTAWTASRAGGRAVLQFLFSADGASLIVGDDREVSVYDAATGATRHDCAPPADQPMRWFALAPKGDSALIGDASQRVHEWDLRTGQATPVPGLGGATIRTAVYFAGGREVVFGAEDGRPRIWRRDEELPRQSSDHEGEAWCVAFAPSGTRVASGGDDNAVRLWTIANGQLVPDRVLKGHTATVSSLAFTPDEKHLVSAGLGGGLILWNLASGERLATLNLPYEGAQIRSVRIAKNGRQIATSWSDGLVRIWDRDTQEIQTVLNAHRGKAFALAFSRDGRWLASVGNDPVLHVWDVRTDPDHPEKLWQQTLPTEGTSVAFSPDGATLAVGLASGRIELRETSRGDRRFTMLGHHDAVGSLAYTPDGETLVSGSLDGSVRTWDPVTGQERIRLRQHGGGVHEVAISPDGRWLASCDHNGAVRLTPATRNPAALAPVSSDAHNADERTAGSDPSDNAAAALFLPDSLDPR